MVYKSHPGGVYKMGSFIKFKGLLCGNPTERVACLILNFWPLRSFSGVLISWSRPRKLQSCHTSLENVVYFAFFALWTVCWVLKKGGFSRGIFAPDSFPFRGFLKWSRNHLFRRLKTNNGFSGRPNISKKNGDFGLASIFVHCFPVFGASLFSCYSLVVVAA